MNKLTFLKNVTFYAQAYRTKANESIVRNKHMHNATGEAIKQDDIDALLVDFVNFMGMDQGIDYALYASDIKQ